VKAGFVRAGIAVFWFLMVGWLVRYEAFPDRFTRSLAGYRGLLPEDVLVSDSWMKILFQDEPVGYARTVRDFDESGPVPRYTVHHNLHLRFRMAGIHREMQADAAVFLDLTRRLQRFTFRLATRELSLGVEGRRARGEMFDVTVTTGPTVSQTRMRIPDDTILFSPMQELGVSGLRPGQELTLQILDPVTFARTPVVVRAVRREPFVVGSSTVPATVLRSEYQGVTLHSWVDEEGSVLRQDTSLGWALRRCSPEEAVQAAQAANLSTNVFRALLPAPGPAGGET